jgi:hypothetical protein
MNISLEQLTEIILRELILELNKRGIKIDLPSIKKNGLNSAKQNSNIIEFTFEGYKTPLVTEERILNLDKTINEIIVPPKTIFTPSSMDLINKRKIKIIRQNK